MTSYYSQRESCLFCSSKQFEELLELDRQIALGCFPVSSLDTPCHKVPYNVLYCKTCGTAQTKYLGDLSHVYGNNFAGLFGTTRSRMNTLFSEFVSETDGKHILEIGAGNGEICDLALEKTPGLAYTIIDPSYWGSTENRSIHKMFFESVTPTDFSDVDTILMSHVFEHFYSPIEILKKIASFPSVNRILLNWPNLEEFIKQGTYHVLNPEHIYYVENQFLEAVFHEYGFKLQRKYDYISFAVFYEFVKDTPSSLIPRNKKTLEETKEFFAKLFDFVDRANKVLQENPDVPAYIWPCSMHTNFCLMAGLTESRITNVLDNSPEKIGNYLYGMSKQCVPFQPIRDSSDKKILLLVGGVYTKEVAERCLQNSNNILLMPTT